jgi:hypothetical protein
MKARATATVLGLCLLTLVGACASDHDPRPAIRTVDVPVAASCAPALPPAPAYPDTDAALRAAPDLFARVRLLVAGRLMRMAREGELSAALSACAS